MTAVASLAGSVPLAELLSDGLFVDGDWIESKDQDPDGDVRLIQLADVGDGVFRDKSSRFLTREKAEQLRCTFLEPGDILVARMPDPLGRACLFPGVGQPAVTAVDVCIIRPNPSTVKAEWLVRAINSPLFRESMQRLVRGTTRQRISRKNLGSLALAVPEPDAQTTLVTTLSRIDERRIGALGHVTAARLQSERLRRAILQAACRGDLTAEWRDGRPVRDASAIVEAIALERKERLGRKYKPSPPSTRTEPLPPGWLWATVGSLVDVATGATPLRKRADYYGGTISWVTSGAVNARVITRAHETITDLAVAETNAKAFPVGTLLVAMYGEGQTRGRVSELGIAAATNQAVAALLFDEWSSALRPYLKLFFLENYERVRQQSFGGVQPNLSLGVIKGTELPLPPADEQEVIVKIVDELLEAADKVDDQISTVEALIERSAPSLLATFFPGPDMPTE